MSEDVFDLERSWLKQRASAATGSNDRLFNGWMQDINILCWDKVGCSVHDLPDQPFRDWFDDGMTPEDALEEIIERENIR